MWPFNKYLVSDNYVFMLGNIAMRTIYVGFALIERTP